MKRIYSYVFASCLLVGGCTGFGKVSGGGTDGGAGAGGGPAQIGCENKPCGALCSACDPSSANCAAEYCDGAGTCGVNYPSCATTQCTTDTDCPQLGAACQLCADGSYACPTVECVAGQCVGSFPTCSSSTCNADSDCPRSMAPCQLCADGTAACPWSKCDNGSCVSGIDQCPGYSPCQGKSCGDTCNPCPPGSECPAVVAYCDEKQQCQLNVPACSSVGCTSENDCPGVGLCPPCPDGSCAETSCVDGKCQFACGGGGACSASGDSCANGEKCCGGLMCCAGVPVPEGQEFCSDTCPISDRNLKHDFASVNQEEVLEKLAGLPLSTWVYKTESTNERHIGPMAQDFMATFRLGSSDRTILQVDGDGVSFAAIQALYARLVTLEQKNAALEQEVKRLQARH